MQADIGFPEGFVIRYDNVTGAPKIVRETRYAGFFPRLIAYFIDMLLLNAVWALITAVPFFLSLFNGSGFFSDKVMFSYTAANLIRFALIAAYFTVFTCLLGATPGKLALRLKVTDEFGASLSWQTALYRETAGRFLNSVLFIGYIVAAFSGKRQSFADMLCDSYVVYAD